jgi:uncharacterized membrane protein
VTGWEWGFAPAVTWGLPLAALLFVWMARQQRGLFRRSWPRALVVLGLRASALLAVLVLLAAPMRLVSRADVAPKAGAVVLFDRSGSMSIPEATGTRFAQSLEFARKNLLPALRDASLPTKAFAFAAEAEETSGERLASVPVDGARSDIGRALLRAATGVAPPPRVIVLLSDGAANAHADNSRALSALAESGIPVVAIGVGGDSTPATLSLRSVEAPTSAPPRQRFRIAAQLESGGDGSLPPFDLQLFRDDRLLESRLIPASPAGRVWRESFEVRHDEPGVFRYQIRCQPLGPLKLLDRAAGATVRIADEREVRVLFAQGALTWDYKFIRIALLGDPAIRLTGLSRTSTSSVLYQNVDDATELKDGFPTSLEQLSPFSVVVLSRLRPSDLSPAQQQLLIDYCGKRGGGVLLVGGSETLDAAWRGTPLEPLLPVRFTSRKPSAKFDPFRLKLTPEAQMLAAFQLSDSEPATESWSRVPPFAGHAWTGEVKAGAEVFAVHPEEFVGETPMPLIAAQRFGVGRSAMIGVRNFWRWRLAADSDAAAFDRFWRQWLRYLADGWRSPVSIHLPDQDFEPGGEIRYEAQRSGGGAPTGNTATGNASNSDGAGGQAEDGKVADRKVADGKVEGGGVFTARVVDPQNVEIAREQLEVPIDQAVAAKFRAAEPGTYTIELSDEREQVLASRAVEVRAANLEWRSAARNMQLLEHWARASGGLAAPLERGDNVAELLRVALSQADRAARESRQPVPVGVNGWTLSALLGSLAAEWLLRKRWGLV